MYITKKHISYPIRLNKSTINSSQGPSVWDVDGLISQAELADWRRKARWLVPTSSVKPLVPLETLVHQNCTNPTTKHLSNLSKIKI